MIRDGHRVFAVLGLALVGLLGCGRLAFDPVVDSGGDADAMPCAGDFLVDTAGDDPGQALACQGAGCSLRAAIAQANARTGSMICVADGLSIDLATSLVVTADVTITGMRTAICAAGTERVFRVAAGGALRLRDLTVCHGRLTDAAGAGVLVEPGATLDVDRVVFDDHVLQSDTLPIEGGAIRADGNAVVEIRRSRFTNNRITQVTTATGFGRGAALAISEGDSVARILVEDTAFEDNVATNVGGALFLKMKGADVTLQRLLFARNTASVGSAIDINCASSGTFSIENTTFVDNISTTMSMSSVIYACSTQTVRLSFCSARGNPSPLVGIDTVGGAAEFRANAISTGGFDLCRGVGSGVSLDGNVTDRDGATCPMTGPNDRLLDPMLGALADNGGPTRTLALLSTSPAIDAAGVSCPAVDQRGLVRPMGAACDAGAFEAQ